MKNSKNQSTFGTCEKCGFELMPVWFIEHEYHQGFQTGRTRDAISHLSCNNCLSSYVIDDSFDGPWK